MCAVFLTAKPTRRVREMRKTSLNTVRACSVCVCVCSICAVPKNGKWNGCEGVEGCHRIEVKIGDIGVLKMCENGQPELPLLILPSCKGRPDEWFFLIISIRIQDLEARSREEKRDTVEPQWWWWQADAMRYGAG